MTQNLLKTPLYNLHVDLGAKMVPFAGYDMPVQYPLGVRKEHLHCRDKAGLEPRTMDSFINQQMIK